MNNRKLIAALCLAAGLLGMCNLAAPAVADIVLWQRLLGEGT